MKGGIRGTSGPGRSPKGALVEAEWSEQTAGRGRWPEAQKPHCVDERPATGVEQ